MRLAKYSDQEIRSWTLAPARANRRCGIRSELPEEVELPIIYEKHDRVAYITFNNPDTANILDTPTSDFGGLD